MPMLVQVPSGSVERSAQASPASSPLASSAPSSGNVVWTSMTAPPSLGTPPLPPVEVDPAAPSNCGERCGVVRSIVHAVHRASKQPKRSNGVPDTPHLSVQPDNAQPRDILRGKIDVSCLPQGAPLVGRVASRTPRWLNPMRRPLSARTISGSNAGWFPRTEVVTFDSWSRRNARERGGSWSCVSSRHAPRR